MRTNVVLDDELIELIERARQLTGLKTKREIIHEALRTLIGSTSKPRSATYAAS